MYFREAQQRVFDSTFLGPELTRLIPAHLLEPANGFSHSERVGDGLWITLEEIGFGSTDTDEERELFEGHRAACQCLTDFFHALPLEALP